MSTASDLKKAGLEHYRAGRRQDAMIAFAQAPAAFLAKGNPQQAAEMANDWGVAAWQAAHLDKAEAAFTQATKLLDESGTSLPSSAC